MPIQFAIKLEEFLKEPFPAIEGRISPTTVALTDKGCELFDELDDIAQELFIKQGIDRRKEGVLKERGYEIKQGLYQNRFSVAIQTSKGTLRF